MQHGTQSRSNPFIAGAIQMLREGVIGDVLVAKAWDIQRRANIGHGTPSEPPPGVDYDLWVGPAEFVPFQANRFHYHWHWWYNFGVGGLGGDGPHEIDYARWGLGVETHPTSVAGLGSKYYFDDDQEYPDTGTVVFEWPGDGKVGHKRQFIFELRIWSTNYPYNVDSGVEFYGTQGKMFLSKRGKLEILDQANSPVTAKPKDPPQLLSHSADFLDAIKTGRRPNAEIEIGHLSTTLVHLGNLAMRVGRSLNFDPHTEQIIGDDTASQLLGRRYRSQGHWAIPKGGADLDQQKAEIDSAQTSSTRVRTTRLASCIPLMGAIAGRTAARSCGPRTPRGTSAARPCWLSATIFMCMDRSKKTVTLQECSEWKRGQSPFVSQHPAGRSGKRGLSPFPFRVLLR